MTNILEDAAAIASRFINNTNRHVFLTGKAGTGKTTFLKYIVEQTYKNTIVAAPTGIAAINAGGVTLHSLFQLPFGTFIPSNNLPNSGYIPIQLNTPDSLLRGLQMHASKRKLLREMELLIIDEVSMLRADLLDAIDVILRWVRRNKYQPFGGIQVLFIGDLFQLPPVVKQEEWEFLQPYYPDIYFFSARALQNLQPVYIELDKIYRQTDNHFITVLNHYRENKVSREDVEALNQRYNPHFQAENEDGYIHLTTHNRKADTINREALKELPGELFSYDALIEGDFNEYLFPVEATLELKEGAQVMFIKNDYSGDHEYFNGKIGKINSLSDDEIRVIFNDGNPDIAVERYIWENKKFTLSDETNEIEELVVGTFSHYPLKLAWAITVHKSQGLTFEKAIIDVSSAFAPGQIYVALSRLVSLDGLVLSSRVPFAGPAQDEALKLFVQLKKSDPPPVNVLPLEIRNCIRDSVLKSFNFNPLLNTLHYFTDSHDKDETKSVKQKQKSWAKKLESDFKPLKETADKFLDQLKRILKTPDDNYLALLSARMEAAKGYFEPLINDFGARVHKQIRVMDFEKKAKAYLAELTDLERLFFKQRQIIYKAEELIRSAMQDAEFSKETLLASTLYKGRVAKDGKDVKKEKDVKNVKNVKNVKKEKKEKSDKVTFDLFKEGKAIKQIAAERSLAVGTIEGHLLPYVSKGLIDVLQIVEEAKVTKVLELIKELDTIALGPLKEQLGDEVSYIELRFIMAHRLARNL
ncbi:MAG: helix-turn-helix domain-containing protein [Bacteroidia bacterium]|nr:helix-turn-helix domain-containing protein [Bacteroidia bacterium]